jgi:hypothetical protein
MEDSKDKSTYSLNRDTDSIDSLSALTTLEAKASIIGTT